MPYPLNIELSPALQPFKSKIEASIKPFIKILPQPQLSANLTLWQSKFGGLPYLPKGDDYPRGDDGKPLFLLAQINFDEVPYLAGFPHSGILQFYIADDELYGVNFDNPTQSQNFRLRYFPAVLPREDYLVTDFSFLPACQHFPLSTSCSLQFQENYEPVGISDYQFERIFEEQFFQQFGEHEDAIFDEYAALCSAGGHKMGGYAYFTQTDPRTYLRDGDHYWLLLQMDTDDAIDLMWGDSGVGNFFIKEEDLRRLDFSKVLYNWDCC